jgi:hypothetical protein
MAGFENDVLVCSNVNFSPTAPKPHTGIITSDGQLLIGASVAPFLRASTLTAGAGISITNGAGTITITNTGGGGGGGLTTLNANSGAANQSGGVITVIGTTGITTVGGGSTLTIEPANDLAALEALSGTGFSARTGSETWALRTFQSGPGISITNPAGIVGDPTISASAIVATTYTADSGSAVPSANNINLLGSGSITTSGAAATITTQLTGLTNHAVLVGAGTSTITKLTVGSNGQVLIGATGADPAFATITSTDSSITFTTGANTLDMVVAGGSSVGKTITGDSGGALSPSSGNWNILGRSGNKTSGSGATLTIKSPPYADAGASATSALNSGSFVTGAFTLTLPVSAGLADGDLFEYVATSAAAFVIQAVGTQKIRVGNALSSAAGTATSSGLAGDSISLRFRAADGFFYATSVIGNFTTA